MSHENVPTLIQDTAELEALCARLRSASWLALDTEFMREKTYRPQLCLIQVATPDESACIDPLTLPSIDPFLDLIYDRNIVKVLHAAGQDMEIFYWLRGALPGPIFDTQIAAPLLGHNEQIGYGNLVKAVLNVELSKSHSRTDWTRRPLSDAQLRYALDDVIYLAKLYPRLQDALEEQARSAWLEPDFIALENPDLYEKPAEDMWLRVKGVQKFKGKALAAIQRLATWRELAARSSDRPRNWLMKDDVLIDIARQQPSNTDELSRIRGLSEGILRRHADTLLELLQEAEKTPPIPLPPFSKKTKLSPAQDAIVDLLTTLGKLIGDELSINPAVLAPRKELERLLIDPTQSRLNQGWRKKLIGQPLQELLNGELSMRIVEQRVRLTRETRPAADENSA